MSPSKSNTGRCVPNRLVFRWSYQFLVIFLHNVVAKTKRTQTFFYMVGGDSSSGLEVTVFLKVLCNNIPLIFMASVAILAKIVIILICLTLDKS